MVPNRPIEQTLIQAFVSPPRRSRYLAFLANQQGREKVRRSLAHFANLDRRFAQRLSQNSIDEISDLLRRRRAPRKCYVFSESDAIDGLELELATALKKVVGQGFGTFLSCVPGRLAYYEGEEPGERYILKRT